jgi:hypothetical protein
MAGDVPAPSPHIRSSAGRSCYSYAVRLAAPVQRILLWVPGEAVSRGRQLFQCLQRIHADIDIGGQPDLLTSSVGWTEGHAGRPKDRADAVTAGQIGGPDPCVPRTSRKQKLPVGAMRNSLAATVSCKQRHLAFEVPRDFRRSAPGFLLTQVR